MPPITTDLPLQREFRRLLNPYLTPQAVAAHEPRVRRIVTELIDDFIEDGQCDLVSQLAFLHPPRMLYQVLFGIEDDAELHRTLGFLHGMSTAGDAAITVRRSPPGTTGSPSSWHSGGPPHGGTT